MEKYLENGLWESFVQISYDENSLINYENYYNSMASWVINHITIIGDDLIKSFSLDTILHINPKEYIIDAPSISLEKEKSRMFFRKPDTLESLVMGIANTLWDLITITAEKECPICTYGELRYYLAKKPFANIQNVILECATCTWTENVDGTEWNGGIIKLYPINKTQLADNGVFLSLTY